MELRHLIVDTDTGSDDVWGIVEALRAKDIVNVEAITTVCGNLPLELCVKNACIAAEQAGGSAVPVYKGADKPLNGGEVHTAFYAHGEDGLGNQFL
ncbi:MAG: nucleoside hydrolase, partial [Parasporobacterium sp.]|nr:nucleoside hydrolase [Parasporobacterium sp.]